MKKQIIIFIVLLIVTCSLPLYSVVAEGTSSGGSVIEPDYPCVSESGEETCVDPDPEPYVPTPCELEMNNIWTDAQTQIDLLLQQPMCADFATGWDRGIADSGAPSFQLDAPGGKMVVIKKKALRKLRRKAKNPNCSAS